MEKLKKHKKTLIIIIPIILIMISIITYFIVINNSNSFISKTEVKEIIYKKTKFPKKEISFKNISLNKKDNVYNVNFSYHSIYFTFKINASNGKIIKNNFDSYPDKEFKEPTYSYEYISMDEAKKLVIDYIVNNGIDESEVKLLDEKFQKGSTSAIYSFKVKYNKKTYKYFVDGIANRVLAGYTKVIDED